MKMEDAMDIIVNEPTKGGYMVHFEHAGDGFLRSDYFPAIQEGERAIETEDKAWALARAFAAKTVGRCVNVYVIHEKDFTPVRGYRERMIENRKALAP